MTPGARIAAAAEILDLIGSGEAAEKALTNWARRSRFAGSSDRAAVRDHVFDVLRCKRSCAVRGGGNSGRELMIGHLRAADIDLETIFTGQGYSPAVLSDDERSAGAMPQGGDAWDMQDWQIDLLTDALGDKARENAEMLRHRANVYLRVNLKKTDMEQAIAALSLADIQAEPCDISPTALVVGQGARKIANSPAYLDGLVELQDAASQAVVDALPLRDGMTIIDYCAGGGGKALAMAAKVNSRIIAHDIDPRRMKDIAARAERAGVAIETADMEMLTQLALADFVLCDAPCSGSGSWRRAPESKWALTQERLAELTDIQDQILNDASVLVAPGGVLAYVTCSLFKVENIDRVERFVALNPGWKLAEHHQWTLPDGGDGFFAAHLLRGQM